MCPLSMDEALPLYLPTLYPGIPLPSLSPFLKVGFRGHEGLGCGIGVNFYDLSILQHTKDNRGCQTR